MEEIYYTSFPSRIGIVNLAWGPRGILLVSFPGPSVSAFKRLLKGQFGPVRLGQKKDDRSHRRLKAALKRYFGGHNEDFKSSAGRLDLSLGTAFEQEVWRKIREIPYGQTRTYGWLARGVGRPGAARAVGRACGRNPLPPIIPCHRVVGSRGELVGYSGRGGVALKRRLLEMESACLSKGRPL